MAPEHYVVAVDPTTSPPWPDCSVRRVVDVDPLTACAAAARLWHTSPIAGRAELRLATEIRVHRWGHGVPVELVVAPWSQTKTEVRLELRTMHLPAGYYPRAHDVTDALCAQLQEELAQAAPASGGSSLPPRRSLAPPLGELARWRATPQRHLRLVR